MNTRPRNPSPESVSKVLRCLEVFRDLDSEMPMGQAASFMMIAAGETKDGGLSVTELSKLGGFALSSASRYVQSLGKMDRHRRPGQELVSDHIDLMERRRKILRLTPKGRRVLESLTQIVE